MARIGSTSELVFAGRVFTVRRHRAQEPGGVRAVREVVHHRGSAVILARRADGRVLLIRQYRLPAARLLWELPAGSIGKGETPLRTAKRELREETGYRSSSWRKLIEFFPSPGFLDEKMTIFVAEKVQPGPPQPEADERIRVRAFSGEELAGLISKGKIRDGKTLVGLLYWQWLHRSRQ